MKTPYLLFDFDGTIADSITPLFHMLNKMAPQIGVKPVSWTEFDRLRDLTPRQILKELKIPLFKMPKLIRMVLAEYSNIIAHLQPCEGILELLAELKQRQIKHALLSSNDDKNLAAFLTQYRIDSFAWVEGTEGVLNKSSYLSKQIRKHKLEKYDLYYIGDEIRDIEAAQRNKIKSIAVSWGLHSHQHLQKHQPTYLVDKPSEILDIMSQPITST